MHAIRISLYLRFLLLALLGSASALASAQPKPPPGFTALFNGSSLNGWKLVGGHGPGYIARDGALVCPADGGGNLFTEKEYADFIFRFEFKLTSGGNNGVGLRAPLSGSASYLGMESQILDDTHPQYANLQPAQYHGSLYRIAPARRGALKPVGEWNREEIRMQGRKVRITLNGKVIVDADLNAVADPEILREHPGMLRDRGHIGFLGHDSHVEFRNLFIRELPRVEKDNAPPPGFAALFNGKNLSGWKGLVADPPKRAKMTSEELAAAQQKADERMRATWKVKDGALVIAAQGDNLCTVKDYGDFEMLVDWKIPPGGDSGIYLRGTPQVQIWDPNRHPARDNREEKTGSGGLYNNEKHTPHPLALADRPVGEWNRLRILMVGDRVTIYLNNVLVVQDTPLENYWERGQPLYPAGSIELQYHGEGLEFKNVYVREIPRSRS